MPRRKLGCGANIDDASVSDGDRRVVQDPPLRVHCDYNTIINQQVRHRAPWLLSHARPYQSAVASSSVTRQMTSNTMRLAATYWQAGTISDGDVSLGAVISLAKHWRST